MTALERFTINLDPPTAAFVRNYAEVSGMNVTATIRQALRVLSFVEDAQGRGAVICVREPDGSLRELVFVT